MSLRIAVTAGLSLAATTAAFQLTAPPHRSQGLLSSPPPPPRHSHSRSRRPNPNALGCASAPGVPDASGAEEEYELVEFHVTPDQTAFLRKEARKREAQKRLPKFFLPAAAARGEAAVDAIAAAAPMFAESELLELRGVSRDARRHVFQTTHALAAELEDLVGRPVVVVQVRGHRATLYCPWDDEGRTGRMRLRSSYRPGQWTKRGTPVRDARGRIMADEHGNSIRA